MLNAPQAQIAAAAAYVVASALYGAIALDAGAAGAVLTVAALPMLAAAIIFGSRRRRGAAGHGLPGPLTAAAVLLAAAVLAAAIGGPVGAYLSMLLLIGSLGSFAFA